MNSTSSDFPQTAAVSNSPAPGSLIGYAVELDAAGGRLLYSSAVPAIFDGGGKGIAIDGAGNVFLTGSIYAAAATTAGAFQSGTPLQYSAKAFVAKLNPAGQTIYSTYFGGSKVGSDPDGFEDERDLGVAVATDSAGSVYVAGYTSAADFPTTAGTYQTASRGGCTYPAFSDDTGLIGTISTYLIDDAFVVKLSADGTKLLASTLLGGSCYDRLSAIAVTPSGTVYAAGETDSVDFPLVGALVNPPAKEDYESFVAEFDAGLSKLEFSTYVFAGTSPALAVGPAGSVFVAGAVGPGAQTFPYQSFVDPFPTIATQGYLRNIEAPRTSGRPGH